MDTMKAKVQYIDAFGRIILLTEQNQSMVLYDTPKGIKFAVGDVITIGRRFEHRRMSDWKLLS